MAISILAGCASNVQVSGSAAGQLSRTDIKQIAAITPDLGFGGVLTRIEAVRPDEVHVDAGRYVKQNGEWKPESVIYSFTAVKRGDHWSATGTEPTQARPH